MASQCNKTKTMTFSCGDKVDCEALPEKEDLTLDPDTAHTLLEISADGKEVKCKSPNPRQFDTANCVVAKKSFESGRHYWEVFVGQKPCWNLGVVSGKAERRGRLIKKSPGPECGEVCTEGYWMIGYDKRKTGMKYRAFDTKPTPFDCSPTPQKIGVYLDYPGRKVTFFNADDPKEKICLYSFHNAVFSDAPVYPFFDPCYHYNGSNNHPLKVL